MKKICWLCSKEIELEDEHPIDIWQGEKKIRAWTHKSCATFGQSSHVENTNEAK